MFKIALVALNVGFLTPTVRLRLAASGTARGIDERFSVGASESKRGPPGEGGITVFGKGPPGVSGAGSASPKGEDVAGLLELLSFDTTLVKDCTTLATVRTAV